MTADNKLIVLKCIRDNRNPKDFGLKDLRTNKVLHLLLSDRYITKESDDKMIFFKDGALRKFKLTSKAEAYINEYDTE
ncbi:hypothetical protein ERX37_03515 [Macrococcus hajekii]|uniref:Uncharacterized protein n=1 Tax=Macrococcus hajekii TaxID=198482 RepID=A0A4R6BN99_9STAP|nr:hypothetical protein [Macrococcus hajekii]TDM03167.1 hypothetical protein ERX37_03515 [Macrococcus hajekii]GGA96499.1 hypothetical protein GCM10007190_00710 [Macrococcus hajekii]